MRRFLFPLFLFSISLFATDALPEPIPNSPVPSEVTQALPSYGSAVFKMIVALVGLVLLIIVTFWVLRRLSKFRFGGTKSTRAIQILEKCPLSAKSILYLVEIDNKRVLIAESQLEVRKIESLEAFEECEED